MPFVRSVLLGIVGVASVALPAERPWYRSPTLAIMTGFIYEPLKPYSIRDWAKGLGSQFDADRWVADFREAGASHLIFYDKWIDGFVFHDTKTTGFKTQRDFVREIAAACQKGGLRLVFYFNAISDGNPEFDQWALLDRAGKPIVFAPNWPTRYQTLHSPFRQVAVEQVRELVTNYGRIDGLWLDIFGERLDTSSEWVARGYERMYGAPFGKATGATLAEFGVRTLASYLDEVRPIAAQHQPDCVWTSNGSAPAMLVPGLWAKWVGSRLDYGSVEGHSLERNDQLARMAWVGPKPIEIGLLLNSSWFTPLVDTPPPAGSTPEQAVAATAIAICQGASVYLALTPGHSGVFGDDLKVAKAVGRWFRATEPVLTNAEPYADVGIVLGAPAAECPGFPGRAALWKHYLAQDLDALDEAFAVSDSLGRVGAFGRVLYTSEGRGSWPPSLGGFRAILVPERALLDDAHAEQLRQYVRRGGRLIAFGHASLLDAYGRRRDAYALGDVFGARYTGQAAFAGRPQKTSVKADSEYSPEFAARHLVDGLPTAWASGGTPMPHWAEITLPEPADVAKVELVSREGPYQVTDIDVEVFDGKAWKLAGSVRGAAARVISASLDAPVRTSQIRVRILKELYQGQDRQYADVEAVRVFDAAGRDRSTDREGSVALVAMSPDLKRAFGEQPVSFLPMAAEVGPTTAEVLARLDNPSRSPAILRNRCGRGEAILFTASEGAFHGNDAFWAGLRRLAVGGPTLSCDPMGRYRLVLTRAAGAFALHAIDQRVGPAGYKPGDVTISLDSARLGGLREVTPVGGRAPLKATQDGALLTFVLRPDPVASVVLR